MSYSYLLLGAPGSGKSTLAMQGLVASGSGLVALAPGLDELVSYRKIKDNAAYRIKGFDDPEFYPSAGDWKATGYDDLLKWLRAQYNEAKTAVDAGKPLPFTMLVTDTFNGMTTLAQNKTAAKLKMEMPPPGKSPDGAAYWGYQKNLQEALARACRAIRGLGVSWVATCHLAEKETKDTSVVNPEKIAEKTPTLVPAISGGFRDSFPAVFDLVFYMGVAKDKEGKPKHYLQWVPDSKRPTKSRLGNLAEKGKIAADWSRLQECIAVAEAA